MHINIMTSCKPGVDQGEKMDCCFYELYGPCIGVGRN